MKVKKKIILSNGVKMTYHVNITTPKDGKRAVLENSVLESLN